MTSHYDRTLFTAANEAVDRAPALGDEIRRHLRTVAARYSAGQPLQASDIDVRTLVALIGQAGVAVPTLHATA